MFGLNLIEHIWYQKHVLQKVLYPFALVFSVIVVCRRWFLERWIQRPIDVPIVVVGNITAGGVGKTPLVISIARACTERGLRVGIVSRGYRAKVRCFPYEVNVDDDALWVGDEPLLLAQQTCCPVVIAKKRMKAVHYLLHHHQCQIIISDDGLQHYAMPRAIEVVVIDGVRRFGNGLSHPAGPLRESLNRIRSVDFLVINGGEYPDAYTMKMKLGGLTSLVDGTTKPITHFNQTIAAVTGIGHPKRFFDALSSMGLHFQPYVFPDHHAFSKQDLDVSEPFLVMTEKDAVKCRTFATSKMYFLPVTAEIDAAFWQAFWTHEQLRELL